MDRPRACLANCRRTHAKAASNVRRASYSLANANSVCSVLGQLSVAHLGMPELAVEPSERVFDQRSDTCLHTLQLPDRGFDRFGRVQQATFARPHGDVPVHVAPGIRAWARALVAGVGVDMMVGCAPRLLASIASLIAPLVPRAACTRPESASTPIWHFIPK